jgi:hypothetical protein
MQQNPFFRAVNAEGRKIDININHVIGFTAGPNDTGTTLSLITGDKVDIDLTPAAVRGRTRKTWPAQDSSSDESAEA